MIAITGGGGRPERLPLGGLVPDRGSVAMYEAVREVAGRGFVGCSGDGFGVC